jgi:3-oxoacyl-[acyl-carrier-protein] synthase II
MQTQKVVITGIDAISAVGASFGQLAENLSMPPRTGTVKDFGFHALEHDQPCYRIPDFDPVAVLGKKGMRTKDWSTKLLLAAIKQGFGDLIEGMPAEERPGLCVGTAFGSVQSIGDFLTDSLANGVNAVNPMLFGNTVINSPTGNANIRFDIRTLSSTISTGFNAALDALSYATDYIAYGHAPRLLACGLEEISYYTLVGLMRSGVLSAGKAVRPFARDGDGFVMGEGCAVLLVESESSAKVRGAHILAEVAGVGTTFDPALSAGHNPAAEGACASIRQACDRAGISPADIGFVAASANGLRALDATEAVAIRKLLPGTPVAGYKAKFGECYGASALLNCACALADLRQGRVSGSTGSYPLAEGVNLVSTDMAVDTEFVLVNSFSCDGNCGSIVLKRA